MKIKNNEINIDSVRNILTLRYDPNIPLSISKLNWKNFLEKNVDNPLTVVETLIKHYIITETQNCKQRRFSIALSGGVDSTLLLGMLKNTLPDAKINTISIKFAESVDESQKAALIAQKFDVEHTVVYIENYLNELPKAISIIKLPFWDLHWYYVAKKAKSFSKILFSGDGGDELFGGYTFRYKKFLSLIGQRSSTKQKIHAYLQCHERDWVPDQPKLFGKKTSFSWNAIYDILTPFFNNPLSPISQVFLADFNGKLLYNWIPLNSKFHEYFGLKSLTPLLSKKIISFATHLPINMKYDYKKNIGKLLLRKLLEKYINTKIPFEGKQGFSVTTINLWKSYGKRLCDYYLLDARICKEGLINQNWITHYINKFNEKPNVRYINKFLGLLAVEVWFRLFFTKEMKPSTSLY